MAADRQGAHAYKTTCRHGTGYSIIESEYAGIRTESAYFVPLGKHYEVWRLRVENRSNRKRSLDVFTYVEISSEWHVWHDTFNLQYCQYIIDAHVDGNVLSCSQSGHLPEAPERFEFRDQSRHIFMAVAGAPVAGFETDRESFLGPYRTYANPLIVEQGRCTNSCAHGDNPCGVFQTPIELEPGETREIIVLLGVGRGAVVAPPALAEMSSPEQVAAALDAVRLHWHSRIGAIEVRTPDAEFDSMVNVWNAYNCLITFAWSRAASLVYSGERDGLGYRDTVQDLLGVVAAIPEQTRERLELMITGQVSTGGAMPVVKPFAHRPGSEPLPADDEYRSDDCLWLFDTVPAYVKETGDIDFLNKELPYADQGKATVMGHLRRALEFNLERRGAHGLPCGLSADWNDTLKLGYRGESVMVTFQLRHGLNVYAQIADRLALPDESRWARGRLVEFDQAIQKHCWDGAWFVRAFRENGTIIGTKAEAEGSIFLNAQSWAVISGAATSAQAEAAMASVNQMLATTHGSCSARHRLKPCRVPNFVPYSSTTGRRKTPASSATRRVGRSSRRPCSVTVRAPTSTTARTCRRPTTSTPRFDRLSRTCIASQPMACTAGDLVHRACRGSPEPLPGLT